MSRMKKNVKIKAGREVKASREFVQKCLAGDKDGNIWNYLWTSGEEYGPNVCPACHSAYWRGPGGKRIRAPRLSELYKLWEQK